MQKALSFGSFSVLAAKTDLDSPALKYKKEKTNNNPEW